MTMEQGITQENRQTPFSMSEVKLGLIAGLVGTIVMDLTIVGVFFLVGMPLGLFFAIIGDSVAAFLAMVGINVAGGVPLGAVLHYGLGLILGLIFVALVTQVKALAVNYTIKGVMLAILLTEIASLPLLITAAIVLKMSGTEMFQWFGGSFVFHIVYGAVLGGVVSYGLRSPARSMGISTST